MNEELQTRIADELMINNMISAVSNPTISKEFLPEQQIKILKIIKDYILKNVEKIETNNHSKKKIN